MNCLAPQTELEICSCVFQVWKRGCLSQDCSRTAEHMLLTQCCCCNSHTDDCTMVVQARDSEICACRVESLWSFHSSCCVTRLLSDPRHVACSREAQGTLSEDAKERLRKSPQSCLRLTLLRLLTMLDDRNWHHQPLVGTTASTLNSCARPSKGLLVRSSGLPWQGVLLDGR